MAYTHHIHTHHTLTPPNTHTFFSVKVMELASTTLDSYLKNLQQPLGVNNNKSSVTGVPYPVWLFFDRSMATAFPHVNATIECHSLPAQKEHFSQYVLDVKIALSLSEKMLSQMSLSPVASCHDMHTSVVFFFVDCRGCALREYFGMSLVTVSSLSVLITPTPTPTPTHTLTFCPCCTPTSHTSTQAQTTFTCSHPNCCLARWRP